MALSSFKIKVWQLRVDERISLTNADFSIGSVRARPATAGQLDHWQIRRIRDFLYKQLIWLRHLLHQLLPV